MRSAREKFPTRTIRLVGQKQVDVAVELLAHVPLDSERPLLLTIKEERDAKSRGQEERYHAMLGDIARQCQHLNMALDLDTWKRLAIDQFKRETLKEPECCAKYWARNQLNMIPSLDGSAMVVLGEQSRKFPMGVAAVFIEWLTAFAEERDVVMSDPTVVPIEAYVR